MEKVLSDVGREWGCRRDMRVRERGDAITCFSAGRADYFANIRQVALQFDCVMLLVGRWDGAGWKLGISLSWWLVRDLIGSR